MKRLLGLILVAAIAITLLPAAMAEGGKTEVVLWNQIFEDWNRAWCEKMVEEFNADPNQQYVIRQEFVDGAAWEEKVAAARAANVMPDMYLVNYSNLVWNAVDGYIQPLDDLIPQEAWDDLHDNVKDMITVKGKKFAYPQMVEPAVVMYYRKDLLAEKNLEVPKTWDEFTEAARQLTTDDMYGATMNYEWSMWGWEFTAAGHWPISEDWSKADSQSQGYVDLLSFIGNLYENEYVPLQPLEGYNGSARLVADAANALPVEARLYVTYYGPGDAPTLARGEAVTLAAGERADLSWRVAAPTGCPIAWVGVEITSAERADGTVYLDRLTWDGAPSVVLGPPEHDGTRWLDAWVQAASTLVRGRGHDLRLMQDEGEGLILQGTREWQDYAVRARLTPHLARSYGLVARAQGLRRNYCLRLVAGKVQLVRALDGTEVLAERPYAWCLYHPYALEVRVEGGEIVGTVDGPEGAVTLRAEDARLAGGAIGVLIEEGRVEVDGVEVAPLA